LVLFIQKRAVRLKERCFGDKNYAIRFSN